MSFMICFQQKKKARVIGKCNALDAMVLATVVCHATAEKVAIEKKIDKRTANLSCRIMFPLNED